MLNDWMKMIDLAIGDTHRRTLLRNRIQSVLCYPL